MRQGAESHAGPGGRDPHCGAAQTVTGQILHVFLEVPAEELHRRIEAQILFEDNPEQDASARAFRHRNVERCVAARAELPADTLVLRGDQHSPAELADLVIEAMGG